jgi:putative SOS response-associated peptidase YedK
MSAFSVSRDLTTRPFVPSYNVAPSHVVPVVFGSAERAVEEAVWGFLAPWKGPNSLVINARVESVLDKPTFRRFTAGGRCVIPLSGYYEWLTNEETKSRLGLGKGKHPFFISVDEDSPLRHDSMMAAAGLLSHERDEPRCVMLTRAANPSIEHIHDRMPLLLDQRGLEEWLGDNSFPDLEGILEASDVELRSSLASRRVNSVRNNSSDLLEPDAPETLF